MLTPGAGSATARESRGYVRERHGPRDQAPGKADARARTQSGVLAGSKGARPVDAAQGLGLWCAWLRQYPFRKLGKQGFCNLSGAIATREFVYPTNLIWIVLQCPYKSTRTHDEGPVAPRCSRYGWRRCPGGHEPFRRFMNQQA